MEGSFVAVVNVRAAFGLSCAHRQTSNGLLALTDSSVLDSFFPLTTLHQMAPRSRWLCRCSLRPTSITTKVRRLPQCTHVVCTCPFIGAILVNPGGPGESGIVFVQENGQKLSKIVGSEFDILGFDPRGIGATTPRTLCFESESQEKAWMLQEGNLLNASDNSIPLARSREKVVSKLCRSTIGGNGQEDINGTVDQWGIGRFVGTASVATDMLRITEKLGQEKLQYWGFVSH